MKRHLAATITVIIAANLQIAYAYRWRVIDKDGIIDVCNDQQCDGRPHEVCFSDVSSRLSKSACSKYEHFSMIAISRKEIHRIIDGHNGLRNRVALNSSRPATNMNLLHWDNKLQQMAEGWLSQCHFNGGERNQCKFICEMLEN